MSYTLRLEVKNFIDGLFRKEYGNIVSFLTSKFGFGFLESAQDIAQDTLLAALKHWNEDGIPQNPKAWLFTVAKNKSLNFIKKEKKSETFKSFHAKESDLFQEEIKLDAQLEDSKLQMIFVCCSDSISTESQIILVLSVLGGFSRKELASALVVEEENIKKRLYRAKKKLRDENTSLEFPELKRLESRLNSVSNSLYLLFNEGYNSSSTNTLIRKDICIEALALTKLLSESFEQDFQLKALFALMCFHIARFDSRIDDAGAIVLFENQDRASWSKEFINQGIIKLSEASDGNEVSSYHLEAGIALQHCIAKSYESTNWPLIKQLYLELYRLKPSPVIQLNIAIVEGISGEVEKAIKMMENLKVKDRRLSKYYLLYASLGEFYKRLNRTEAAISNFKRAIELTHNQKEKELLLLKTEM